MTKRIRIVMVCSIILTTTTAAILAEVVHMTSPPLYFVLGAINVFVLSMVLPVKEGEGWRVYKRR